MGGAAEKLTKATDATDEEGTRGAILSASPELLLQVEPEKPGPETLCKLRVRLKNRADRSVSSRRSIRFCRRLM